MPGEEKTRRPNGSTPKPKAPAPAYAAPPPALAVSVAPPFAAAAGALVVAAPSPALVQLGQFLAAGQPPPPALLSRALQDMRYPPHVVALPMANQVLHPEIQAAVVAQARQAFAASCACSLVFLAWQGTQSVCRLSRLVSPPPSATGRMWSHLSLIHI